ncbi:hypothetical protein RJ640_005737 [Escallonia rubra]|uniref:SWIB complex BAF60b domain-containing protein n=1 Tax=Escallonia rubra TaxID=112253 RepID=A0AA88UNP1_9ASTE|nr:hypothetical protein RJ640_005737 [Escallonia rubra]
MVSDQELAKSVEALLRQSDPNAVTTLNGVVQQLEAKLGLSLAHKAGFIRDQINLLLRSHPQPLAVPPPVQPSKDHFALQQYPQFQNIHPQFIPQFALQQQQQQLLQLHHHHQHRQDNLGFLNPPLQPHTAAQPQPPVQQLRQPEVRAPPPQHAPVVKAEQNVQSTAAGNTSEVPKESAPTKTKRRGGPGGLNKVCGVSPELQVIVGEPALPRTEIVKQLWQYIRKNNLQDPSNKRKIICDDALRAVFEIDCTDMFKMNKLLAKHIIRLEPTKETGPAKRLKVDVESATESTDPGPPPVVILSDALANFFGTGERDMLQSEAFRRVWEYIKLNNLEDPLNSMVIRCDEKLKELFGGENISAVGVSELLARDHLFKQ